MLLTYSFPLPPSLLPSPSLFLPSPSLSPSLSFPLLPLSFPLPPFSFPLLFSSFLSPPFLSPFPPSSLPPPSFPPSQILTKDSVTARVDAVVYFRIKNPIDSVVKVENAFNSTYRVAQTSLRDVLGTKNLAELLSDREHISEQMGVGLMMCFPVPCIIVLNNKIKQNKKKMGKAWELGCHQ